MAQKLKLSGEFNQDKKPERKKRVSEIVYWDQIEKTIKKKKTSSKRLVFTEEDDPSTSGSSSSSSSDDEIIKIHEEDYLRGECIQFSFDIYNIFIAMNITKAKPYLYIYTL
jgi:hypothetical protein